MFHVSHLKKCLLRLPNGKTVKNINNYKLELIKHAHDTNRKIETNNQRATNSSQTSVKSVLYNLHNKSQTIYQTSDYNQNWYQSTSVLQNTCVDKNNNILYLYHAHPYMTNSNDILADTVFSPVESFRSSVTPAQ